MSKQYRFHQYLSYAPCNESETWNITEPLAIPPLHLATICALPQRSILSTSKLVRSDFGRFGYLLTPTMAAEKPSVLIIGGMGYIGRFLARHIHENQLASEVRLVDKKPPEIVWLAPEFEEACSRKYFMQKDASKEGTYDLHHRRSAVDQERSGQTSVAGEIEYANAPFRS